MTKEELKEYNKEYRKKNKDKIKEREKEWRKKNKEKIKEQKKEYRKKNKDKINKYKKEYHKNNKEKRKEYCKKNKEKIKEQRKEYCKKNKEKIKERKKEYRKNNKDKIKEYHKEYRKKNKEKIKEQRNEYCKKNKDKIKEYHKNNKDKINKYKKEYSRKYTKNRRMKDPLFRIMGNTRNLISFSIKKRNYTKKSRTQEILGCSYEVFNDWLNDISEYKGKDRHLDHVVPVSLAKTEEEVLLLNHYTNFQYLKSTDNITKGNKHILFSNLSRVLSNHPSPNKVKSIIKRSEVTIK